MSLFLTINLLTYSTGIFVYICLRIKLKLHENIYIYIYIYKCTYLGRFLENDRNSYLIDRSTTLLLLVFAHEMKGIHYCHHMSVSSFPLLTLGHFSDLYCHTLTFCSFRLPLKPALPGCIGKSNLRG